jgi:hypothetical protein
VPRTPEPRNTSRFSQRLPVSILCPNGTRDEGSAGGEALEFHALESLVERPGIDAVLDYHTIGRLTGEHLVNDYADLGHLVGIGFKLQPPGCGCTAR